MALDQLKKKIEGEVTKRIAVLSPKLDELIRIMKEQNNVLKKIEKNTRK